MDATGASYTYDGSGHRVRKDAGSTKTEYVYFNSKVIAEYNVSTGDWSDYVFGGSKRIARALALDNGLRIYGTMCSSCSNQYSLFYIQPGTLANYVVRTGDKLNLTQYQATGAHGGVVLAFTDGTSTNWSLKDQDGYYANDDQTQSTTHVRKFDLSAFAGKKISSIALNQESDTAAGAFAIIYEQAAVISADGTVQPLYTGESSSPVTSITATSGVTGTGSHIDINRGKGVYPSFTTTYYHQNQVQSSTLITAGNGWPVWQATYLPFGEEYSPQLTDGEHYKFTGKERDSESGLDNFGARYYASVFGRFMSPDWAAKAATVPYATFGDPQSLNLYSYVENGPINRIDADGHNYVNESFQDWGFDLGVVTWGVGTHQAKGGKQQQSEQQNQSSGGFGEKLGNFVHGKGWKTNDQVVAEQRQWLSDNKIMGVDAEGKQVTIDWSKASAGDVSSAYAYIHSVMAAANANHILRIVGVAASVTFGHGARHLEGTGLNQGEVEAAIDGDIQASVRNTTQPTGSFWGRVNVGGKMIEYRAYTLPNGTINVGTYYIP